MPTMICFLRRLSACALLVMVLAFSIQTTGHRTGPHALAQSADALKVVSPADGATIYGLSIPVVWNADRAGSVAIIVDDAADPSAGKALTEGDGVAIASDSPSAVSDVKPGQHTVSVVRVDDNGKPVDGADPVTIKIKLLAPQTAGVYAGVCNGVATKATYTLDPVGVSTRALAAGQTYPAAEAIKTDAAGVSSQSTSSVSDTTIDASLSDLTAKPQVIAVSADGIAGLDENAPAACGEIGGAVTDGVLRVGLRQQAKSTLFGVATLIDAGDKTRVVIETSTSADAAPDDLSAIDRGQAPKTLPAAIYQGTCNSLNPDITTPLDDATLPTGDAKGVGYATPVLSSQTEIDTPLNDLLTRASSIAIASSGLAGVADGTIVACGEIGGAASGGVIRIGLTTLNDSGVQGVATLFATGDTTTVLLETFRTAVSNASPSPSASPSPTVRATATTAATVVPTLAPTAVSTALTTTVPTDVPTVTLADTDGDGVPDTTDNCTFVYNPDQADSNGDFIGDACTEVAPTEVPTAPGIDSDGDGIDDELDNCPNVYNPDQADTDGDGVGDACQAAPPTDVPTDEPTTPVEPTVPEAPTAPTSEPAG